MKTEQDLPIEMIARHLLELHPAASRQPELHPDDPTYRTILHDVRDHGIRTPLFVDSKNQIVDGRVRYQIARDLKGDVRFDALPCLRIADDEALSVMLGNLIARRHYGDSALAYVSYFHMKEAHEEARRRALANLKIGKNPNVSPSDTQCRTVEDLASKIGISPTLFKQAAEVHKIFEKRPEVKAEWEPKILLEGLRLGGVLQGVGSQDQTKGKPVQVGTQLELFSGWANKTPLRFDGWEEWEKSVRDETKRIWLKDVLHQVPRPLLKDSLIEIKRILRESGDL